MKAAVFYGPENFKIETVNNPVLEPEGVIIRVRACGICGSDLHTYNTGGSPEGRRVLGHEFSGDIVEVGRNVTGIKPGMRVVAGGSGAYAEYVGLRIAMLNRNVFPLPDDLPYEVGATTEPMSIGVNAAKRAEPRPEDVVVVLGAGAIGQGTWQAFKATGAAKVIVVEKGKKRIEAATSLGATMVINAAETDPVAKVMEVTKGWGADIVADCGGYPTALQQASEMVRGGGYYYVTRMMSAGTPPRLGTQPVDMLSDGGKIMMLAVYENKVEWQPTTVMVKGVRMIGCIAGSLGESLNMLKSGKIKSKPLITHTYPLDKITEAFQMQARTDESIKVMIEP